MLGYFLAAVIGLSLGILGGGGSILTVPIFVYAMHEPPKLAIAMSLPVVGATALVAALGHWRAGNFDPRIAAFFGAFAMIGAFAGARVASAVSGVMQLALLGAVMLVSAVLMLRGARRGGAAATAAGEPAATHPPTERPRLVPLALVGVGVGILTGLVGIGGGFLFVPALVLLGRVPMKTAVGTSLVVIAMNTVAGSLGYHGQVDVPWRVVVPFTAVAIAGSFAGTHVVRRVSQTGLRRGFAYFLFAMAAFILYQNRAVIAHPAASLRPTSSGVAR